MRSRRDAVYLVAAPEVMVSGVMFRSEQSQGERECVLLGVAGSSYHVCSILGFPGMLTIALHSKMN